jgi:hypothetical protein
VFKIDVLSEQDSPTLTSNGKVALVVDSKTGKLQRRVSSGQGGQAVSPMGSPISPRSTRLLSSPVSPGRGSGRSSVADTVNINQWMEQRSAKITDRDNREKAAFEEEKEVRCGEITATFSLSQYLIFSR